MAEQVKELAEVGPAPTPTEKERADRRNMTFTELALVRLKPPKVGQVVYWDSGTDGVRGLSVLVSAGGAKTFRATYYWQKITGKKVPVSIKLGRVGEMDLGTARELTKDYRKKAAEGVNPVQSRSEQIAAQAQSEITYQYVVDEFIKHYAKPRPGRLAALFVVQLVHRALAAPRLVTAIAFTIGNDRGLLALGFHLGL